jgi:large subunit ribosomal protein L15
MAMSNIELFIKSGKPIPKNGTPPLNALEYYTSSINRGYLADPQLIIQERIKLAQKYGYKLQEPLNDNEKELLTKRKDPTQIWFNLEPGWIINAKDKTILKPTDNDYINYYKS